MNKYFDSKVFGCTFCYAILTFSALHQLLLSLSDVTYFVKLKQGLENKPAYLWKAICPSGNWVHLLIFMVAISTRCYFK